jgi:hypothetical protein
MVISKSIFYLHAADTNGFKETQDKPFFGLNNPNIFLFFNGFYEKR